jgi:hypothetical protein
MLKVMGEWQEVVFLASTITISDEDALICQITQLIYLLTLNLFVWF